MTEKTQGIFVGNRLVAGTPTPSNFTKKVVECTQVQYDEWKTQGLLVADTPYLITDGGDVTIINDTVISLDTTYSSQHEQALLDSKANVATTYSKAEVDGRIKAQLSSALKYKGKVATVADLPANPTNGDSYVVEADGLMYAWSDTSGQWDALGSITDLTDYYTKAEIDQILSDMQVKIQYAVMPLPSAEFTYPIQYIGVSDDNYTSGNFYSAVEESGSYVWKEISDNDSSETLSKIVGVQNFLAAKKRYSNTVNVENNNTKQFATFLHITDIHGDAPRFYKGMELADFLGVTGVFMTGDIVENKGYEDDFTFVTDHLDDYSTPIYETIGNHDGFGLTENQKLVKFTAPFAEKYGYTNVPSTNSNQWYKDLPNEKLRIISLQPYRYVSTTEWVPGNSPQYDTDQVGFLQYTLRHTPDNYGIIILMHGPEKSLARDYQHDLFKQPETFFWTTGSGYTMFTDMVDDYISRTGRTFTHTNTLTDGSTFTTSWDFGDVPANNGVEFIGWVTGHTHSDNIAYVPGTTNKQLMLNMACSGLEKTTTYDINKYNDLAREVGTDSEYLFNTYIIDRELKQVKVIRIGAHLTYDLIDRNYMLISYK